MCAWRREGKGTEYNKFEWKRSKLYSLNHRATHIMLEQSKYNDDKIMRKRKKNTNTIRRKRGPPPNCMHNYLIYFVHKKVPHTIPAILFVKFVERVRVFAHGFYSFFLARTFLTFWFGNEIQFLHSQRFKSIWITVSSVFDLIDPKCDCVHVSCFRPFEWPGCNCCKVFRSSAERIMIRTCCSVSKIYWSYLNSVLD